MIEVFRAVFEVARPVFKFFWSSPGQQGSKNRAGHYRRAKLKRRSFLHGPLLSVAAHHGCKHLHKKHAICTPKCLRLRAAPVDAQIWTSMKPQASCPMAFAGESFNPSLL